MPYSTLLDGFSVAGRLILCQIIMSVKIFLWSLLFVIPGIVAAYRYRFAYYNLLTDNSLSASGAIALSWPADPGVSRANSFCWTSALRLGAALPC